MTAIPEYSTAMPDWEDRLEKGLSLIPEPIFPEQADLAMQVFSRLRAVDVVGCPTYGQFRPQLPR
ncbi:4R [Xanthomonas phage Xp10]|uniref:4R n=1 Tax=Xanthomonas phage Xp10 TaxID=2907956 RepID=Q7Y5L3_9CAUD|nr:terminase large subunit [Xanthomonas phage Xp10]AAP58671.1 4R [Xanthomonas phage Xp10]